MSARIPLSSITLADVRKAALARAGEAGGIPKGVLALLFEEAFGEPRTPEPSGRIRDLCSFIAAAGNGEDMDVRCLALPFEYTNFIGKAAVQSEAKSPIRQSAYADLVRAVATFFLREQAFWCAVGDADDAEQEAEVPS
jgi:hypothetical protein